MVRTKEREREREREREKRQRMKDRKPIIAGMQGEIAFIQLVTLSLLSFSLSLSFSYLVCIVGCPPDKSSFLFAQSMREREEKRRFETLCDYVKADRRRLEAGNISFLFRFSKEKKAIISSLS